MTLVLKDATVRRSGRALLDAVDLTIPAARFTAICGPNGAGKTTALRLFAGSMAPDKGEALIDGRAIGSIHPRDLARRRAVLPQSPVLSFPFLVHEVVAMGRSPHQGTSSILPDTEIISNAMALADVMDLAERNYLTLSGGERQRVQLARTLAQLWEPPPGNVARWLLLDEPTSALDLKHQISVMRMFRRLARDGWGILAVLHDLRFVREYADDCIMMAVGKIVTTGPAQTILTPEMVQHVFDLDAPFEA